MDEYSKISGGKGTRQIYQNIDLEAAFGKSFIYITNISSFMWKYGVYLLKEKDVLKRGCAWNFVFWFGQIKIGNKKQTMLRIVNSIPLNWKRAVIVTNRRHPVLLFLGTWWWCLRGQWQRHGGLPLSAGGCRDMPQGRGPLIEEEAQQPHGDRPGLPWKIREWELPALFAWWL